MMHPGGWSADVCEAAAAACAASATPPPPAAARALGVGCEGLASLWHQRRGAAGLHHAPDHHRVSLGELHTAAGRGAGLQGAASLREMTAIAYKKQHHWSASGQWQS